MEYADNTYRGPGCKDRAAQQEDRYVSPCLWAHAAPVVGGQAMMPAVVSLLGLTNGDHILWWIAIGVGFVVVLVVIVLLSLLVAFVNDIDRNVADTWETATRVAANTATTWSLQQVGATTGALRDETRRHEDLLSGRPVR